MAVPGTLLVQNYNNVPNFMHLDGEELVTLIRMKSGNLFEVHSKSFKSWPDAAKCVSETIYSTIPELTLRDKTGYSIIRVDEGNAYVGTALMVYNPGGP